MFKMILLMLNIMPATYGRKCHCDLHKSCPGVSRDLKSIMKDFDAYSRFANSYNVRLFCSSNCHRLTFSGQTNSLLHSVPFSSPHLIWITKMREYKRRQHALEIKL